MAGSGMQNSGRFISRSLLRERDASWPGIVALKL